MRILTISNCPLIAHQGSGYVTLGYVEGLRARGWSVDAFGPEHFEPWRWLRRASSWRITLGMLFHALRSVVRADYDIVEFYGGEAWLALHVLARWPGRRFMIVSHSNGLETLCSEQLRLHLGSSALDARERRWYQVDASSLMAHGFRTADALVVVSANELRYAREQGYQRDSRLLAIDNPLPEGFGGLPLKPDRKPVIGYCGSWIARKGTALIVSDISRILRELPDVTLRLIGVGSAFRAAEHFPQDVVPRIEVLPFIDDKEQLRAAYSDCAICIVPSAYESFGLTIAEAMACGCAVVATRTGFAAGLRDGVEACLLPQPRTPHLYTQVRALLDAPERRARIAAAGHARVQRLRWKNAVDTLAAAYESWLAERRGFRPQPARRS
jgi:glycosyltransferase involved in cell wall biosynthesis